MDRASVSTPGTSQSPKLPSFPTSSVSVVDIPPSHPTEPSLPVSRPTSKPRGKGASSKPRWLSHLKNWVSMSEPSTQAFMQHKKDTYSKAGIALDDPKANAKLHFPMGTIPDHAIKPAGRGPEPEELARRRAAERRRKRHSYGPSGTRTSHSLSSRSDSASSIRPYINPTPWEQEEMG